MLQEHLSDERIIFFGAEVHKQQALTQLMDIARGSKKIVDGEKFVSGILERENIISTGIGLGIAIPHTYSEAITDVVITVGISSSGISDYGSIDEKPVHFIVMVAAGSHQHREYLEILARISLLAKNEKVRNALLAAQTAAEVITALVDL
ncbi:MAG: PTS sugar transporter subunit IIA [Spirochaetota bacterium]|jgi:mannitol/fructose-specific phosphotransferase system IIA component (Ntr-type)|nr:PTS sugar transporter subunit IIA [Spirochaetota bacterium]